MSDLRIDVTRFIFERNARNTYENMMFSKKYREDVSRKPWLLVTSASHMPRAARIFCRGGWTIVPYPVDYKTEGKYQLRIASASSNFEYLHRTIKELVGIIAYGVTGKLSMNACNELLE